MSSSIIQAGTTVTRRQFGVKGLSGAVLLIVKNDGLANVYFDFDNDANVASAYLAPGESITFDLGSNDTDAEFISVLSASGTCAVRIWWAQR